MARTHQVHRNGKGLRILSPLGTRTDIPEMRDFTPQTVLSVLNDCAVDISENDVFTLCLTGGQVVDIAVYRDGEVIAITQAQQGVIATPLPPISATELAEKARVAIRAKAANTKERTNFPIPPQFKSFLARIKYMIYMDSPSGSAPKIPLQGMSWDLAYHSQATGMLYRIFRIGDSEQVEIRISDLTDKGQDVPIQTFFCPANMPAILDFIKSKGWR